MGTISLRPIDQARLMVPRDFELPLVQDPASLIVLGDYVVSCCGLPGVLLVIAWILVGDCLDSCWGLLGFLLGIAWILVVDCRESCWGSLGFLAGIVWAVGKRLSPCRRVFGECFRELPCRDNFVWDERKLNSDQGYRD